MMHFKIDDAPGFSLFGDWKAKPKTVWCACGYAPVEQATKDRDKVTCKNCKRTKRYRRGG